MHLRRLFALAAALLALAPADAQAADEKEACVRAVEHGQVVRLDGKLREARASFVTCARPVCPTAIRDDCTRWVTEVDASLPSVVLEAVWADGRDATGMTVTLDGQPLAGGEGGRAVPMDPGEHAFRFEVAGAAPVEQRNVIREGEKNRVLHVVFTPTAPGVAPPVVPPPPEAAPSFTPAPPGLWREAPKDDGRTKPPSRRGPIPLGAFVLGGVGLVSFGGFAYFGLSGTSQLDSMRSTCGHTCNPSDVSSARNQILLGDILGYVGLAATGASVLLVLLRPDATASAR